MMNGAGSAPREWVPGCYCNMCNEARVLNGIARMNEPVLGDASGLAYRPAEHGVNCVCLTCRPQTVTAHWAQQNEPIASDLAARISSVICQLDALKFELSKIKAAL